MDTNLYKSDYVSVNGIRLHYLDWGGPGPALLFLAGMGCSAHIFERFAPRFRDRFQTLALTRRGHGDSDYPETGYDPDTLTNDLLQFMNALEIDRAILAGHSLAYIELCHLAALHPERLLKLVFLDAAYDSTTPEYKVAMEKNPLQNIIPPWPEQDHYSVEDYAATLKRTWPALAAIWDVVEGDIRYTVKKTSEGKVVDKMSDAITQALNDTIASYVPEYSSIQAPVLSIYAIRDGSDYLSSDYMTEEQKAQVIDYFNTTLLSSANNSIEQFRRKAPHAKIVVIPSGHHYCFIKQEDLVFNEMIQFLLK